VGLGLVRGLLRVNFSNMRPLAQRLNPKLQGHALHFFCPYPLTCLTWVEQPEAYTLAGISLRVIGTRKPAHEKAVVVCADLRVLLHAVIGESCLV
jgi:tRNA A37 threonylcarbamoyladenosine synthetase subunit TsaC/SUA5/YrdC